ncbi:TPA: hypothetical protein CPT90_05945 [Candidatus Gastranaerophilales bacterium HUM_3]|nr:MAG TPA: hypothetical protein CPT90_05945 [Candidatus Gastranaerophilales bacterium HUM_3]
MAKKFFTCFYMFRKVGIYMNVNSISPVVCKANIMKNAKQITAPLKDGNTLRFTVGDNYIEALVTKGDKIVSGTGKYSGKGIKFEDVNNLYEKAKPHIKEGFDFFKELVKTIMK